jgi:hypothetical protein
MVADDDSPKTGYPKKNSEDFHTWVSTELNPTHAKGVPYTSLGRGSA